MGFPIEIFSLSTPSGKFKTTRVDSNTDKPFRFLIPSESIINGKLNFNINILNPSGGRMLDLETGEGVHGAALKFGRLSIYEYESFER